MWQEARKQEKKLRCIMIDYKKRAERRQAYYARMRMDPHQLMRVYGQKCKFHIVVDNAKVNNTDGQLMPWQGDPDVMIDRFDVRAHLDFIPEIKDSDVASDEQTPEEEKFQRKCSYERYRTLVQIDATGASEEQYLKQLAVEEGIGRTEMENKKRMENDKITSKANAKFHYKYDDSSDIINKDNISSDDDSSHSDGDLSDIDIDINVNVLDLNEEQTNHLDALATQYGIGYGQYCKQLLLEKKEFEYVKKLEEEEEERAKMPGRKGKSARRSLRAKQKTLRGSPLSFALHEESPKEDGERTNREGSTSSDSSSHSKTPVESKVEFITSFGGEEDNNKNGSGIILPTPVPRKKSTESSNSRHKHSRHRSSSQSQSDGKSSSSHSHKSRDRHKLRSRSREHHKSHHSSSKSRDKHSKSSHSRHSSKTKNESHSERLHSAHTNVHLSRSRSPRNSSSHRSRSGSSKRNDNNHRNTSRSLSHKSSDRSKIQSRSRSRSKTRTYSKESYRRKSKSRSRSMSTDRSKSPHETIVKRLGMDTTPTTVVDKSTLTPREKMKLRMQKLLNRQIKTDKKQEHKKQVAKEQEIEERDMEIYEMSRMLRMREREKKVYRSPSPKGRMPSYDASRFRYVKSKSSTPE